MSRKTAILIAFGSFALLQFNGCGSGGSSMTTSPPAYNPITISLSSSATTAPLNGASPTVTVTVQRVAGDRNSVTLSVSSVPGGVTPQVTSPGTGNTGSIAFSAASVATPGTYSISVNASEGGPSVTAPLSLTVLSSPVTVNVAVSPVVNTSVGFGGQLQTFMTTTFQAAEWDQSFFPSLPNATNMLANLGSQHIRILTNSQGIAQKADQSWDFSVLNATLDPVIGVGDKSVVLVLAAAPAWMNDQNGDLLPAHFQDFANYAAQMVKYYNTTTGFTDANGVQHIHASLTPITYWGIFNEPDVNGLSAAQYASLYNATVAAMQSAGSIVPLKFFAVELGGTDPNDYVPAFIQGVTAQVDVLTGHNFAVCGMYSLDADAFGAIPSFFVPYVQHFVSLAANSSNLSSTPVWMSDNNVDACFDSSSIPPDIDPRGTSAFFAAWRPYVFSQWAQAGSHMLSHWDYNQDPILTKEFGEVAYSTGQPYVGYWVDYYLHQYFPYCAPDEPLACTATGSSILNFTSSEAPGAQTVEVLATRNPDGSVVIMAADHALNNPNDDNGPGALRTVVIDISQLGHFSAATELTIDASLIDPNTNLATEPVAQSVVPAPQMTLNMGGYGVTFLKLIP
jgi:hypothetical protein